LQAGLHKFEYKGGRRNILVFGFLKEVLPKIIGSFEIVFKIYLLYNSKFLNPCEFSINASKSKAKKKFPQNLIKSWDVTSRVPSSCGQWITSGRPHNHAGRCSLLHAHP
jgi:hypothetical protein